MDIEKQTSLQVAQEPLTSATAEPKSEADPMTEPSPPPVWLFKGILLTSVCTLSIVLVSSTLSSGLISLPVIGRDLGIREDQLQWISSAYSLSSGCLLIPLRRLADLYGRRKVFIMGCIFQGAFALGCGFANDLLTIAVLRGFQGLGAAATIPASLGILAHAFPPGKARSLAFATFSAGQPLGGGLGFAVGGLLTQYAPPTWRTMFYVVAGLSALCIIGALVLIAPDHPSHEVDKRVDWLGVLLVTSGLVLIVFVLSDGEVAPKQWSTPYIIALLVIGVVLTGIFLLWQWYLERPSVRNSNSKWTPPPLMKLSLCWMLWAVLYYQDYKGLSPVLTMIRVLPMVPTGILCNVIIGLVIGRVPGIFLISFGCLCTGLAGLLFAVINPNAIYWAFGFPAAVISVFGADFVFAAGALFVAKVSLPHEQSLAGGLFQTMAQLGTSFGLAITTIVFDRVRTQSGNNMGVDVDPQGSNALPAAQLRAFRAAQWTNFAFGAFACILALLFLRGVGVVGGPHKPSSSDDEKSESDRTAVDAMP
ncbi:putative efflux transporter [Panus rudis PR-1116 ss-1]|nr:putative efflux transporter [Panus rudis PR-1116 ss-1]